MICGTVSRSRGIKRWAARSARTWLTASCGDDDETEAGGGASADGPLRVAVAPSASNDLAFSQSMVDGVANMSTDVDVDITDGTFIVEDAAAAIRGYAEDGFDL